MLSTYVRTTTMTELRGCAIEFRCDATQLCMYACVKHSCLSLQDWTADCTYFCLYLLLPNSTQLAETHSGKSIVHTFNEDWGNRKRH